MPIAVWALVPTLPALARGALGWGGVMLAVRSLGVAG